MRTRGFKKQQKVMKADWIVICQFSPFFSLRERLLSCIERDWNDMIQLDVVMVR